MYDTFESLVLDRGFKPNIAEKLSNKERRLIRSWEMPTIGTPVLGLPGVKIAVWIGQAESLKEIPVISVASRNPGYDQGTHWHFGLAARTEHIQLEQIADAAEYAALDGISTAIQGIRMLLQ